MNDVTVASKDKLISDMKVVMADADELLRATASQAGDRVTELRGKIQSSLANARANLADAQAAAVEKAKEVGHAADDYVQANPWRSVGIAAGVGLVVGLLIGRR
jgi:ElaB/YqjD/DUF883 family membrane-anchored ribosome-binding protein